MTRLPSLTTALVLCLGAVLPAGEALAQSFACQRYRAELASLGRASRSAPPVSNHAEISRLSAYYHSLGCASGGFSFFGPPEACAGIAQRIRAMEATASRVASDGDPALDLRRQRLRAAIAQACDPARQAAVDAAKAQERRARGDEGDDRVRRASSKEDADDRARRATGGSKIVCVRACDGFFFPLSTAPDGRAGADELCRALCPGAETAAYAMPGGEGSIDQALSLKGKPYVRLAAASKYLKSFDPSCSCKKDGQTWAQLLARAERMLDRRPGDIIVTARKAEELSRPKIGLAALQSRPKTLKTDQAALVQKAVATDVLTTGSTRPSTATPESRTEAEAGAAAPTATTASAGIGPQSIEGTKVLARTDGPKHEVAPQEGPKRTVRVIAPDIIPVPGQQLRVQ